MSVHLIQIGLLLLVHLLELQQALPPKFGKLLFIMLLQLFIPIPVGLFTVNSFIKTVLSCYISKMQVDYIIYPFHCPSLHIIPIIFWKNNWNLSKANYQSFFFGSGNVGQWKVPTALGVMSISLFLANRYFLNKGAGSIGMASVFEGEQANAPPEFQPVFAIFQWPARAKVAHLKHSTVNPQLNHCQGFQHKLILIRYHAILLHYWTQQMTLGPDFSTPKIKCNAQKVLL